MKNPIDGMEAVLFDLDDTLLKVSAPFQKAILELARACSEDPAMQSEVYRFLWLELGSTDPDKVKGYLSTKIGAERAEPLGQRYIEIMSRGIVPYRGARALLRYLENRSIPLGIVTNGARDIQYGKMARAGILRHFLTIQVPDSKSDRKPSLPLFKRALDDLDVDAEETLFIGDKFDEDIEPAASLGMRTVHVFQGRFCYHRGPRRPVLPDFIVEGVWELLPPYRMSGLTRGRSGILRGSA